MKKFKIVFLLLLCTTITLSSFTLFHQEIIKATSDWFLAKGDTVDDCYNKLKQNGGNLNKTVKYTNLRTKKDELDRIWYQTDCFCEKKE